VITYVAGMDVNLTVPLKWDGELFVPDNGTAEWALRDHTGTQVTTGSLTGLVDTSAVIYLAGVRNEITTGRQFEKRTVILQTVNDGSPVTLTQTYRIAPWINTYITPEDIRRFVGVTESEIADTDVDIFLAFQQAQTLIGEAALSAALISGVEAEAQANRTILGFAVLEVIPGLRQRVMKKESDGTRSLERFDINFDEITRRAQDLISRSIQSTTSATTLFYLTNPTDPVTGV